MKNRKTMASVPVSIPKRRFPEFRARDAWQKRKLSYLLSEPKQRNRDLKFGANDVLSVSGEFGCVNQIALLGRSYAGASVENYHVVQAGDVVYTKSPLKRNPYGIIKANKGRAGIVSTLYAVYRPTAEALADYLDYYFSNDYHLNSYLQPIVKKGAKNDMKVNNSDVLTGEVWVPEIDEQQKIAECLSTFDELIVATGQKLDALKAHKKGLMQQLCPREGETVPRLRFPEFQDAPDWKSDSLGKIFNTASGGTPSRAEKSYWNGSIPWITTSLVDFRVITGADEFITAQGLEKSSAKLFPKGTVLMAMYGQGKTRGQVALLAVEVATNQACAAILPRSDIDPYFVFLNLAGRYEEIRRISNAGGQENLSQDLIRGIAFSFPESEDEQRKVTDCLSFLDDLITAQSDQLETLKAHKKGLMQQLFPSPAMTDA